MCYKYVWIQRHLRGRLMFEKVDIVQTWEVKMKYPSSKWLITKVIFLC